MNTPPSTKPRTIWDPRLGWRDETKAETAARVQADDDRRYAEQQERNGRKERVAMFAEIHAASQGKP